MSPSRSSPGGGTAQGGFVLVMVLALLVVLTLLAAAAATSASRAIAEAQANVDRFEGELDIHSTQETLLYLLATQPRNLAGLPARPVPAANLASLDDAEGANAWLVTDFDLHMDGRVYAGLGQARFYLQDDAGLLSPNWASSALMTSLFAHLGVAPDQWPGLDAKRLDYQDPDSLHRLDGAEADHYRAAGRPPPTNRPVTTPLEFRRIMGWDEMLAPLDDAKLLGMLSIHLGGAVNLNTAPPEVLALIPGMDSSHAERLVAQRRLAPISSVYQARESFPIAPFMEEVLTLFPNRSGNLILWDRRFGAKRLVHWTLTPQAIGGPPWQVDYEVILPRDNRYDAIVAEKPPTPLFSTPDRSGEGFQPGPPG